MSKVKIPPIGLTPKEFYYRTVKATRYFEIRAAIDRYIEAGLTVDHRWIKELRELEVDLIILTPSNQEDKRD